MCIALVWVMGICPHPHSKWCIQAHSTYHPDQLSDRPCQSHIFITMVWRLPYVTLTNVNIHVFHFSCNFPLSQDKHSIPFTMGCTNIQCRPCIRYDGCGDGFFNRGTMTYLLKINREIPFQKKTEKFSKRFIYHALQKFVGFHYLGFFSIRLIRWTIFEGCRRREHSKLLHDWLVRHPHQHMS